ncbi:MAG TPA: hypothetical protein VGB85_13845 [Nannocystis sp.]|jgi:hypothetical protein
MRLTRQTLIELSLHPNNNVSGIFGPRCRKHVGLEDSVVFARTRRPTPRWG